MKQAATLRLSCVRDWFIFQPERRPGLPALLPALGLLIAGLARHEPWRDEIQAWLMAGSLSLSGLAANAGAEGHPIGWHLLCKLLMVLDLPFESLYGLCALCALCAVYMLARRAPFPPLLSLLAISGPLIILLGISARPYMLIVILLLLQAALFPERMRRPWAYALCLCALSQLMVLCLPYVGLMALWWLAEAARAGLGAQPGPRLRAALALVWTMLLLAFWQLLPPWEKLWLMLDGRMQALGSWSAGPAFSLSPALPPAAGAALGLFLIYCLYGFHPALALAGLGCLLFALGVDLFVYPLSDCHWFTLFGMLLALGWIALGPAFAGRDGRRRALAGVLALAALWVLGAGAPLYWQEMRLPSSNLAQAAAYARQHLAGEKIAVHTMAKICPLLKDMPEKSFWNPVNRSWGRFAIFDAAWQKQRRLGVDEAAGIILHFCPAPRPVMIFSAPWPDAEKNGYCLAIEFSEATVYDENFYFYRALAPAAGESPAVP